MIQAIRNSILYITSIFFLEKRRRTALHYIKKEKRREEIPESTRENSTHPNTRQHTQPSTHKQATKGSKEIGAPVIWRKGRPHK
jgi:hypothetical protein